MMTPFGGESDPNIDVGRFQTNVISDEKDQAGNRKRLANSARISSIQAYYGTNCLVGIKVSYVGNTPGVVEYGDCSSGLGKDEWKVSDGDKIVALNIYSKKKDPSAPHETVVGFMVSTRALVVRDFGLKDVKPLPEPWTTRIHHESWSLKGFWVQTAENPADGILRLGGIYGKDEV
jgi:hypothetical protein